MNHYIRLLSIGLAIAATFVMDASSIKACAADTLVGTQENGIIQEDGVYYTFGL